MVDRCMQLRITWRFFLTFSLDFSLRLSYVVTRRFRRPSFFFFFRLLWLESARRSQHPACTCNSSLFLGCVHMFSVCNLISTALSDGFFSFFSLSSLFLPFLPVAAKVLKAASSFLGSPGRPPAKPRWLRGNITSAGWADGTEYCWLKRLLLQHAKVGVYARWGDHLRKS